MNRQDQNLNILNEQVVECILCDLSKTRTHAVPGHGNTTDKIMMIGEAPGKNEDQKGVPFVGSAGKILDLALSESGLNRNDVYITNVVKCRPPGNRVPTDKEIEICTNNYLKKEIKLISPKVICIMGVTALKSLLGYDNMGKYRGRTINYGSNKYFVTYHPAATIYNSKLKEIFFADIKKLHRIINEDSNTMENYF